jgi:pyrroline-5-carboxylate reductase
MMPPFEGTTLGFVGTGTITAAIVAGLRADPAVACAIVVSPRNADVAARLAADFPSVAVAASNQAVVDASDVVLLAVRPQIAEAVLTALEFRRDQRVISLIATFSKAKVESLIGQVRSVSCAVPQPTVAARLSPTAIFPPDAFTAALFDHLGTAFEVATESDFRALFATTAAMASFFSLQDTLAHWLIARGVPAPMADDYIAKMFRGLADVPRRSRATFAELAAEFKTKGGLNEQFANELARDGVFAAYAAALDSIAARIAGSGNPG